MTNFPFGDIGDFRDIESLNHYAEAVGLGEDPQEVLKALRYMGRDNARTPVQWDDSTDAGFTTGTPWIAVNPNYREINAAAQIDDEDSVFHHYRRVIALRHTEKVVATGDFRMLLPEHEQIYAFVRAEPGTALLVLANMSDATAVADQIPDAAAWERAEVLLTNAPPPEPSQPRLSLQPWEARVYRRRTDA